MEFLNGIWYFCMYDLKRKVSFRVGVKPKMSSKIAVGCVFHSTSGLWSRLKKNKNKKTQRKRNFVGSREGRVSISEHGISGVLVKSGDSHQFVPALHPCRDCQRPGNKIVIEFRLGRAQGYQCFTFCISWGETKDASPQLIFIRQTNHIWFLFVVCEKMCKTEGKLDGLSLKKTVGW